jgi:phage tail-like protein
MIPAAFLPPILQPPHDPTSWLLNARVGWKAAATSAGVEQRPADGALALAPRAGTGRSLAEPGGSFGGLRPPGNVALGPDGSIYLLDASALQLKRLDPCACAFVAVPCFGGPGGGPRQFQDPHGIAICAGNLFVCDTGNHRLAVFALRLFLHRGDWRPPASAPLAQPWEPYAVAFDGRGRAFVTDPANGSIHRFAADGRWEKAFAGFVKVTAIAIDCGDHIHVVQEGAPGVRTIDADGNEITPAGGPVWRPDALAARFPPPPFPVDAAGNLHLRALLPAQCLPKPQAPCAGPARPEPEPGVFDLNGNPVDPAAVPAPVLPAYPLPSPPGTPSGTYYSAALDSRLYRCQWHRVVLRGRVPQGTRVVVATYTSEVPESDGQIQDLPEEAWQTHQAACRIDGEWDCPVRSGGGRFLWLRLQLYSNGADTPALDRIVVEFPRISLRRYLPAAFGAEAASADFTDRFLSLFDTVFRGIERTIDTQARFFDPLSTPAERDPKTGVDFLSWLAGWIGLSLDRHWPESKRRQFLKSAGALYDIRGTREGLRRQLLLYLGMKEADDRCADSPLGHCCPPRPANCAPPAPRRRWEPPPLILEHYQLRRWLFLGAGRLGDQAVLWGKRIVNRSRLNEGARVGGTRLLTEQDPFCDPFHVYAHQFTVFVPACFGRDETGRKALDNLLKAESPAQAKYRVNYVEPHFRIGVQSSIGLDAVIARVPEGFTLGRTPLDGSRTLTGSPEREGVRSLEIGREGRIGSTTLA